MNGFIVLFIGAGEGGLRSPKTVLTTVLKLCDFQC